jgi:excisionase family DNA binding protein
MRNLHSAPLLPEALDVQRERLLSLKEASQLPWLPSRRSGRKLHYSTLLRWVLSGRLPAVRVGSSWAVTESDLAASFAKAASPGEAVTAAAKPAAKQQGRELPAGRLSTSERQQLARLGLGDPSLQ